MQPDRAALVRRGLSLTWLTLGYNTLEAILALLFGAVAASIALEGFGLDSLIELSASAAALWRLRADVEPVRRHLVERRTQRFIGGSFLALAGYVLWQSATTIVNHTPPRSSPPGIALAIASLLVMPLLARAKRRVASGLGSAALRSEAMQTSLCAWLSAVLVVGLALNALFGWWWADPVAALAMIPVMLVEGRKGLRGEVCCDNCS
jgi:divalent metal cation (Fe/Co/Zn/Cd) transporter